MSRFSTSQFEDLIKKRLKCKNLDYMRFDYKDLSRVDPKVLAKGLFENNKVDEVYMKESCLTTAQLEAIFTQIAINPKKKPWGRLDISYNDLSGVHPKIMAKAVTRFKSVDLNDADMTMKQAEVLFKEILASETVRKATTFVIDKELCEKENNELAKVVAERVHLDKHSYLSSMIDALSRGYERDLQLLDDQEEEFDFEYERQQAYKRSNNQKKSKLENSSKTETGKGIGSIRTAPASTYTEKFYSDFNNLYDKYLDRYKGGAYEEQKAIADYEEIRRKEQQKMVAHEEEMRKRDNLNLRRKAAEFEELKMRPTAPIFAPFACPVCPKTWLTKQALDAHVSSNHRYEC